MRVAASAMTLGAPHVRIRSPAATSTLSSARQRKTSLTPVFGNTQRFAGVRPAHRPRRACQVQGEPAPLLP